MMWYPEVDAVMAAEKSDIQYKLSEEDDGVKIRAFKNKKEAGEILIVQEYVGSGGDCYPFEPYEDQPFYDKICDNENVTNIQHLEVKPKYRGIGIATSLMQQAMKYIKTRYKGDPVYINASPMGGDTGLSFGPLVDFYRKFGFKVLKEYPEHRNALLWRQRA